VGRNRIDGNSKPRLALFLILFPLLFTIACSDETLSLFFDIPPPTAAEIAAAEREKAAADAKATAAAAEKAGVPAAGAATAAAQKAREEAERPAIESVKSWEEAQKLLPQDKDGGVDWVAAIKQGVIKPRAAIDGPGSPDANIFKWDFYFPGPNPEEDAYFPHSTHTEWISCESCHPRIFRHREIKVVMDRIFEGQFCGACHGNVAFPLESCARCHTAQAE